MHQIKCLVYEEWAIEFLEKIWKDDFIDFKTTIRKVQQNDRNLLILMLFLFLKMMLFIIF